MPYQSALTRTEQQEADYIRLHGEKGAETVAEVMIDQMPYLPLSSDDIRRDALKGRLLRAIVDFFTPLEIAEMASKQVGGPSFNEFVEDEEEQ